MLQSISIHYDAIQDRLAVRVCDADGERARDLLLHLTRRVSAALRHDLQQLADVSAQAPERLDAPAKAAVSRLHHEALASQAPTRHDPRPADSARGQPKLVTGVACGRRREDGKWVIRFELLGEASVTLTLSLQTLHGLIALLRRQTAAAQWALPQLPADEPPRNADTAVAAKQFH